MCGGEGGGEGGGRTARYFQRGKPRGIPQIIEDVSINNEYEYENDFKPYSHSKSFSQLSMLAMTSSLSL